MKRKLLTWLLLFCLALGTLTACGGEEGSEETPGLVNPGGEEGEGGEGVEGGEEGEDD